MEQFDTRTKKIRDRIYFEIQRVLAQKNKEKPNPENSNKKPHKIYWLYEADIVYFPYINYGEYYERISRSTE